MGGLYSFIRYTGRLALPMFFGKLEIRGRENIPADSPCLITPNHQAAFLDSVLIGSMYPKPIHYLARADVFSEQFTPILSKFNMMPIYRLRDGYDKLAKNKGVFERCDHILRDNGHIVIYPEASMKMVHYLRPLTKGAARMAFQVQGSMEQDLYILPVGLSYWHHFRPRYRCILNIGKPIRVRDYINLHQEHKAKGLISLRDDLSTKIKELLVIPEKEGYEQKINGLHRGTEGIAMEELTKGLATGSLPQASYYPWLRPFTYMLAVFNPLAIGLSHYMLSKIGDAQFSTSIKYIVGLLGSMIWWPLLFFICQMIWGWQIGIVAVLVSICALICRAELQKFISKPDYLVD